MQLDQPLDPVERADIETIIVRQSCYRAKPEFRLIAALQHVDVHRFPRSTSV